MPPRYAIRLRDLRYWHVITVTCPACGHKGRLDATALGRGQPDYTRLMDLERRLRCRSCGNREDNRIRWRWRRATSPLNSPWRRRAQVATVRTMCNLYSLTRSQEEISRLARALRDLTGNLPPLPGIYPDTLAPVVRTAEDGVRELAMMRWGFPPPPKGTRPVTNVRNLKSGYWRPWLKPEQRCLVPLTSFCEYTDSRPKVTHWFALLEVRPLFWFAGIWRPWTGARKGEDGEHHLYAFLTCPPNETVKPIHAKAMPVILTSEDACERWLTGSVEDALALQQPAPDDLLQIVAKGAKTDDVAVGYAPLQPL